MNLDDFFIIICMRFYEIVVCTRYVPLLAMVPSASAITQLVGPHILLFIGTLLLKLGKLHTTWKLLPPAVATFISDL